MADIRRPKRFINMSFLLIFLEILEPVEKSGFGTSALKKFSIFELIEVWCDSEYKTKKISTEHGGFISTAFVVPSVSSSMSKNTPNKSDSYFLQMSLINSEIFAFFNASPSSLESSNLV